MSIYFIKYKSKTFECFKNLKALVENEKDSKIKCLRTDREDNSHEKNLMSFVIYMELKENPILLEHPNKMG